MNLEISDRKKIGNFTNSWIFNNTVLTYGSKKKSQKNLKIFADVYKQKYNISKLTK
jgi:hypothetical protein